MIPSIRELFASAWQQALNMRHEFTGELRPLDDIVNNPSISPTDRRVIEQLTLFFNIYFKPSRTPATQVTCGRFLTTKDVQPLLDRYTGYFELKYRYILLRTSELKAAFAHGFSTNNPKVSEFMYHYIHDHDTSYRRLQQLVREELRSNTSYYLSAPAAPKDSPHPQRGRSQERNRHNNNRSNNGHHSRGKPYNNDRSRSRSHSRYSDRGRSRYPSDRDRNDRHRSRSRDHRSDNRRHHSDRDRSRERSPHSSSDRSHSRDSRSHSHDRQDRHKSDKGSVKFHDKKDHKDRGKDKSRDKHRSGHS
jgi:hypothetical protein